MRSISASAGSAAASPRARARRSSARSGRRWPTGTGSGRARTGCRPGRGARRAHVDRHRHAQLSAATPMRCVVAAKPPAAPPTNASLSRATDQLGRGLLLAERHLQRVEVHAEGTAGHERGSAARSPAPPSGPTDAAVAEARDGRAPTGSPATAARCRDRSGGAPRGVADLAPAFVGRARRPDAAAAGPSPRPPGAGGMSSASPRRGSRSSITIVSFTPPTPSVIAWWTLTISAARSSVEALDDRELPQRAGPVEALHGDRLRRCRAPRAWCRLAARPDEAEVVVEVEVRVDVPPGRGDRQRVAPHPLAQAGDQPADPVDAPVEALAVGRASSTITVGSCCAAAGPSRCSTSSASASLIRGSNSKSAPPWPHRLATYVSTAPRSPAGRPRGNLVGLGVAVQVSAGAGGGDTGAVALRPLRSDRSARRVHPLASSTA